MKTVFVFNPALFKKEAKEKKISKFVNFLKAFNNNTYYLQWLLLVENTGCKNSDVDIFLNNLSCATKQINEKQDLEISHDRVICIGLHTTIISMLEKRGFSFKAKKRRGVPYWICVLKDIKESS